MKNIRLRVAVVVFTILLAGGAGAQSIYGINFLGEHLPCGGSRFSAIGYSGLAVADSVSALPQNLASLSGISKFTFSVDQTISMGRITSGESSSNQVRFELPSVMLVFPVMKGVVVGTGYRTRFLGKGDFSFSRSVEGLPTPYEVYKHRSNLFTVPLVAAAAWGDRFSFAAEYQVERGSIRDEASVKFVDEGIYYLVYSRVERYFSGSSFAGYAQVRVFPSLYLGCLFDAGVDYRVDETFKYTRGEFDSTFSTSFKLPSAFGMGVSINVHGRWWFHSSYWRRGTPDAGIFPQFEGALGDEYILGMGIEREGEKTGTFLSRLPLRFGFYQDRWHFDFPGGEPLYSRFFSVGSSFEMPGGPGRVDLSLEFGQIGSVERNGVGESLFRMSIGVSASEKWSRRRSEW